MGKKGIINKLLKTKFWGKPLPKRWYLYTIIGLFEPTKLSKGLQKRMLIPNLKPVGKKLQLVEHRCIYMQNFPNKLKTCYGNQDRYSFRGFGSGSYHNGH